MNKSQRCLQLALWLMDGERFTITEAATRLDERYINIWRDLDSLSRMIPVAKDDQGKLYLVRISSR